jgi:toxin HigB-1
MRPASRAACRRTSRDGRCASSSTSIATCLDDLRVPPGNRLHGLEGDRKGQCSISINDQWRICFRFLDGDAFDVEIADYH